MKSIFLKKPLVAILAMAFIFSSCEAVKNTNNTQRGGAIGATSGAVLGGVIGNNVGDGGNSVLGAIVGGVVGGAAGAYIGNRMDKQAQAIEEEIPGAEVSRVGEGISVTFDENSGVYFATNKHELNQKSQETLNKLVKIFKEYPNTNVLVEGHTDNTGRAEYNLSLSEKRAYSVTNYLVGQGLASSRFTTKWYGETQPKHDNTTAEGRSKNRRVELAIVANEDFKKEAERKTN
ncbi:outer membrane protein OmpA-like peptidoglycan-associated protein [Mesonia hippocampi]|uniref:Outer membrane protein OmpA-like peptidoglycan-associated protein n=1 Tax=Mesonia hippocampi TaxID=1628250 RepID=A0A840ELB4_9FLAO|nr:OmpA family protein [Mesonia hippocampi]MBB4119159.1 outer membrane protein OmpA-like peptidoglycan-associated protein [Mesonia hippocampi]